MPRFHFHFRDDSGLIEDCHGVHVADEAAAVSNATGFIRDMVAQEVRETGDVKLGRSIEIAAHDGPFRKRLGFHEVISIFTGQ